MREGDEGCHGPPQPIIILLIQQLDAQLKPLEVIHVSRGQSGTSLLK